MVARSDAAPLRFWAVTGSVRDVAMYRKLADDFTKRTGVPVEVTPLAWGNFLTKYFAAMAAGLPPDIGVTNLGGPFDYGTVGGLVDLRSEFPTESKELESRFNPGMLNMFTMGPKLFGIPSDLSTMVLYYRTDTFTRLGLKPPKTWSELNATIHALEAKGYRYYFGFTNGAQWAASIYTMPYGLASFQVGPDGKPGVPWNDPKYQRGIGEALRLWYAHDSPGKDLQSRAIGMFRSDDPSVAIPLMLDIHSTASQIEQNAPELHGKWDVMPWPRADDGKPYYVLGGTAYVIFRKSERKREAMQWLMYLNSPEAQRMMIIDRANRGDESALMISSLPEMWTSKHDDLWSRPEMTPNLGLLKVIRQTMPYFATVPTIHGSVEASRLESNLMDQMGTYIRDRQDTLARSHGITRSALLRRFAQGEFPDDQRQLDQDIDERIRTEYAKIAPEAERIVRSETERYDVRYGEIVRNLPKYERAQSVLDVIKWLVGLVTVALIAAIGAIPRLRKHWISYVFIAAPVGLAVVFVFVPAITALYLSFTDYHPVLPLSTARWTGTENYAGALSSGDVLGAVLRTGKYVIATLPIGIGLSLLFAYLLNAKLRAERFWRFLYFSPLVTSVVSIALIFTQLFLSGQQGWLNALLLKAHLISDPIPFLTSEHTFMDCVIVLAIWQGLAFTILVFLAGLQQIPEALFEAAAIDGAGAIRRFVNVAVPGLRPQLLFTSVLGLIGSFQVFETIYVLAGKSGDAQARFGPNDSALTMVPLIYHTGFETFEMGKSAAYAYILFVMILILTVLQMRVYRKKEGAE